MHWYENKIKLCIWRYVNLLHYGRRPTCFGHLLWPSSRSCFPKDILQRTSNTTNNFWIFSSAGMHRDLILTSTEKKPTSTDTINFSFNHPTERKLAAYRYLTNGMHTWLFNNENKHKEWNTILHIVKTKRFPYSIIWKLNTQVTQKLTLPPSHNSTRFNSPKNGSLSLTTTQQ